MPKPGSASRSPKRALTRVALPRSLKAGAALVQLHVGKDRKDLLGKVLARFSRVRRDPLTVKAAPAKPKRAPKAAKKSATAKTAREGGAPPPSGREAC